MPDMNTFWVFNILSKYKIIYITFHQLHHNIFIAKIKPILQSLANTEQIYP
jgi:hypothetical protein